MDFKENFKNIFFQINKNNFESHALALFHYQAVHNPVYKSYLTYLRKDIEKISKIEEIPFLPIEFFKSHAIKTDNFEPVVIFESSKTTGQVASKHFVKDIHFYQKVSQNIFEYFYGSLKGFHILALLPSYLERNNSSLVHMVDFFIKESHSPYSNFFLHNFDDLAMTLEKTQQDATRKTLLIGVTFALLDFVEKYKIPLKNAIIMETGGMKGKREELIREQVHTILKESFQVPQIHAEYGMTELLSQAYAQEEGIFATPPWMQVYIRDIQDPLHINNELTTGGLNIVDLANIDTCAFIETQDIGTKTEQNFQVLGRVDTAELRGCNLMVM